MACFFSGVVKGCDWVRMCLMALSVFGLSESYDSFAEKVGLGDGGVKKAHFVRMVQPEMVLLDHQSGHRLAEGPCCDLIHPEAKSVTVGGS